MRPARFAASGKGFLVESNELADRARKARLRTQAKRIAASQVLKPRHEDCKAKRVEPRILQRKVVRQRRQSHFLARRDVANFVENGPLQGHDRRPLEAVSACGRKPRVLTPRDRIIAPRAYE